MVNRYKDCSSNIFYLIIIVGGYTASWAAMSYPKISAVVCIIPFMSSIRITSHLVGDRCDI